jgi:hypothetical protein
MASRTDATKANGMAHEVKRTLGVFLRPLEKIRKNPRRASMTPQTTVDRLRRDIETSVDEHFSRESADVFFSRVLELIPSDADLDALAREGLARDRAKLRADTHGAQLLALYEAADKAGPVSPLLVYAGDDAELAVDVWSVLGELGDADKSRGEKRARALRNAIPDLIEKIYARHLRAVWRMSFLAEGKWPSPAPHSLGQLVGQTAARLHAYTGLVDLDAAHFRNAVAHRSAKYNSTKRVVEFRDFNPSNGKTWQKDLTLPELDAKLAALWIVSYRLTSELRSLITAETLLRSGMFAAIPLMRDAMRGALHGDLEAAKALTERTPDPNAAFTAQLIRRPPPPKADLWFRSS